MPCPDDNSYGGVNYDDFVAAGSMDSSTEAKLRVCEHTKKIEEEVGKKRK